MRSFYFITLLLFCFTTAYAGDSGQKITHSDADNDGIVDSIDKCPNTSQLKKLSPNFKYAAAVNPKRLQSGSHAFPVDKEGCEFDSDGDGVIDSKDYCPQNNKQELSKGIAINGCPKHSDFDGTPDYRDQCPNTPRGAKTDKNGC